MRYKKFLTLLTLVFLTAFLPEAARSQSAYERSTFTKVEPDKHSATSIENALKQGVIQVLDTNVTLNNGQSWTSSAIKLQNLYNGYPSKANLIVDITAGSISALWRENYGLTPTDVSHFQNVQAPDSGQVIIPTTAPWTTAGVWRWETDPAGGASFYYRITAHANGTAIRNIGVMLLP